MPLWAWLAFLGVFRFGRVVPAPAPDPQESRFKSPWRRLPALTLHGLLWELGPGPLVPWARIMSLDHATTMHHSFAWYLNRYGMPQQGLAERGFNPRTFGLWAQHASHCATPLDENDKSRCHHHHVHAPGSSEGQGESVRCLVRASTPEARGHAGVRLLLLGERTSNFARCYNFGLPCFTVLQF